jgi:hypothetical protein
MDNHYFCNVNANNMMANEIIKYEQQFEEMLVCEIC